MCLLLSIAWGEGKEKVKEKVKGKGKRNKFEKALARFSVERALYGNGGVCWIAKSVARSLSSKKVSWSSFLNSFLASSASRFEFSCFVLWVRKGSLGARL